MKTTFSTIKDFLLEIFFPRFCLGCGCEGSWLCEDCLAILEIQNYITCPICSKRTLDLKTCNSCKNKTNLSGLLWAVPYNNLLVKNLIHKFKYEPFLKELKSSLSYLIISHLLLIEFFSYYKSEDFVLVSIPLHKRRLRWRGFNQAEEIAKKLSKYLKIPFLKDVLIRRKETFPQIELEEKERKENIKEAFVCKNPDLIKGRKIFLIDDVYTTGATMEEAAKVLKTTGAKEVWGMVIARG